MTQIAPLKLNLNDAIINLNGVIPAKVTSEASKIYWQEHVSAIKYLQ